MNTRFFIGLILVTMLGFTSCETGPGEGGTSTIRGELWTREYNGDFTVVRDEYPGAKEDVYIIYGDDYVYGDKFETDDEGHYEFKYLREGHYTVYAFSDDSTNLITDEMIAVKKEVDITGKDQVVEVPRIVILK